MKARNFVFITAILLSFLSNTDAQTVSRGPYLQMVTTSSIYVHWRTTSSTQTKVWYGSTPGNLTSTLSVPGTRTEHEIHITGLTPNTVYYYAVGNNSGVLVGGDANHFFKTSPFGNSNETIRAWVLGNAGNDSGDQEDVRDGFYSFIGNTNIDMMLLLGDNAYDDGTDSEYQDHWFDGIYQEHIINSVMWSTFGNHDGGASDSDEESGPYYETIFNFPKNAQAGGVSSGTEAYYSFDYGNIHFLSINSFDIDRDVGEDMYNWVVADLNSTNKDWIVAFFHYPPYTGNDNNSSDTHPKETDMRENFLPILEAAGVDLVLSSHHHSYQRSYLINGHYDVSSTWNSNTMGLDLGDGRGDGNGEYTKGVGEVGTVYIVAGSAGSTGSNPAGYPAMYTSAQDLGSVYMEVTGLQMDVAFVDDEGNVDDYFTIVKTPDGNPSVSITAPADDAFYEVPEPINIVADATDENGSITQVEFFIDNISIGSDYSFPYNKLWTPPADGCYEIKVIATDNSALTATDIINVCVGNTTVVASVSDEDDDAEQAANGLVSLGSSDLELTMEDSQQKVGIRFTGLGIPQGAYIENATIQFTCDEDENISPCNLIIYGEDNDNALTFDNVNNNISNRPKTSASVNWSPPEWNTVGEKGIDQKTVDISPVIQEIVNRAGFTTSSSISIIIEGIGQRKAVSYDGNPADAPVLTVEYNLNGPLPIDLLNFNAQANKKTVRLNWTTVSELDNDFFTLERSNDGHSFKEIATISGNGTTNQISEYSFVDQSPEAGINYYRLKQTDFDASFSYSKIVSANIYDDQRFLIYPSIVKDVVTIEKGAVVDEEVTMVIYNLTGKAIGFFKFPANEKKMEIPLTELSGGTYFLSIFDSKNKQTFKFVKL